MKRRFADTYFWLAYLNPKDAAHELPSDWMNRLQGGIVTTDQRHGYFHPYECWMGARLPSWDEVKILLRRI